MSMSREEREAAVQGAIESGASTWREVGELAGVSHEGARLIAGRLGLPLNTPTGGRRPPKAERPRKKKRRRRRPLSDPDVIARFWDLVDKSGEEYAYLSGLGPCWTWTGARSEANYGHFSALGSKSVSAHRYAWRLTYGSPVPPILDHLCHSLSTMCAGGNWCKHRACVNPAHLEGVSQSENTRRRWHRGARSVYFCRYGHEFDANTTLWDTVGRRVCRTCLEEGWA